MVCTSGVLTRLDSEELSTYNRAPLTPGANMQITNVRVYSRVRGTLRSHADVTFDNCLCIKEFRLLRVRGAYVLCMPYEKEKDGSIRDLAFPSNDSTLQMIQKAIIAEYEKITGPRTRSKRRVGYLLSSLMPAL